MYAHVYYEQQQRLGYTEHKEKRKLPFSTSKFFLMTGGPVDVHRPTVHLAGRVCDDSYGAEAG